MTLCLEYSSKTGLQGVKSERYVTIGWYMTLFHVLGKHPIFDLASKWFILTQKAIRTKSTAIILQSNSVSSGTRVSTDSPPVLLVAKAF